MTQRRSAALAATCFLTIAAIAPASAAGHHKRHVYRSGPARSSHSLTSRGWGAPSAQPVVVGRLAQVITDSAQIVGGRDRLGRVLSVCQKGQCLAINSETPTSYGVLMIDRSIGYISKSDVQLLNYQVVSNDQQNSGVASDGSLGSRLVQEAVTYLQVPYLWGGNTRDGIDCSGFVKAVFASAGISLPRVSRDQATVGYDVPLSDVSQWMPGDRMYFACHHLEIDHTGMYIGNGQFIHASAGHGHQVAVDSIYNEYYSHHLVAVRRSVELWNDQQARRTSEPDTTASTQASTVTAAATATEAPADQPPSMPAVTDNRTVPPADDSTPPSGDPESNQQ